MIYRAHVNGYRYFVRDKYVIYKYLPRSALKQYLLLVILRKREGNKTLVLGSRVRKMAK